MNKSTRETPAPPPKQQKPWPPPHQHHPPWAYLLLFSRNCRHHHQHINKSIGWALAPHTATINMDGWQSVPSSLLLRGLSTLQDSDVCLFSHVTLTIRAFSAFCATRQSTSHPVRYSQSDPLNFRGIHGIQYRNSMNFPELSESLFFNLLKTDIKLWRRIIQRKMILSPKGTRIRRRTTEDDCDAGSSLLPKSPPCLATTLPSPPPRLLLLGRYTFLQAIK